MRVAQSWLVLISAAAMGVGGPVYAGLLSGSNSADISETAYSSSKNEMGVVLVSVNWQRKWKCGEFENAELLTMGFDLMPITTSVDRTQPAFFLDGPPRLTKSSGFVPYVALLNPSTYALSQFDIKAARSVSEVGHFSAGPKELIPEGKDALGTFDVRAGEVVYIGHFFVDCAGRPIPWRFYVEDRDGFAKYIAAIKAKYPFLDVSNAQFRLLKTEAFGRNYDLPQ